MAEFNPRKWEDKAWSRYSKRVKGMPPSARLEEAKILSDEIAAINGLKELVAWCNLKRITVDFTNRKCGGAYVGKTRTIYINSTQSPEKQLFVLLHECGHLLIDNKTETTELRFRHGYPTDDPDVKRKFIHRCTVVEEEFEAWHRGRKLAMKLGIQIDDERFSDLKASMLKSYMKWAVGDPLFQTDGPG
jgi:hypothetical protein